MSTLSDFVNEYTEYDIVCSDCGDSTVPQHSEEDAISTAEEAGFEVVGDDVLCPDCQ